MGIVSGKPCTRITDELASKEIYGSHAEFSYGSRCQDNSRWVCMLRLCLGVFIQRHPASNRRPRRNAVTQVHTSPPLQSVSEPSDIVVLPSAGQNIKVVRDEKRTRRLTSTSRTRVSWCVKPLYSTFIIYNSTSLPQKDRLQLIQWWNSLQDTFPGEHGGETD